MADFMTILAANQKPGTSERPAGTLSEMPLEGQFWGVLSAHMSALSWLGDARVDTPVASGRPPAMGESMPTSRLAAAQDFLRFSSAPPRMSDAVPVGTPQAQEAPALTVEPEQNGEDLAITVSETVATPAQPPLKTRKPELSPTPVESPAGYVALPPGEAPQALEMSSPWPPPEAGRAAQALISPSRPAAQASALAAAAPLDAETDEQANVPTQAAAEHTLSAPAETILPAQAAVSLPVETRTVDPMPTAGVVPVSSPADVRASTPPSRQSARAASAPMLQDNARGSSASQTSGASPAEPPLAVAGGPSAPAAKVSPEVPFAPVSGMPSVAVMPVAVPQAPALAPAKASAEAETAIVSAAPELARPASTRPTSARMPAERVAITATGAAGSRQELPALTQANATDTAPSITPEPMHPEALALAMTPETPASMWTLPSAPEPALETANATLSSVNPRQLGLFESYTRAVDTPVRVAVETPVRGQGFPAEFAEKIVWLAGRQSQSAELSLNPPQLGALEVRLSLSGNEAGAQFYSPHPQVREAIEAALPRLRDLLAQAGIALGDAQVREEAFSRGEQGGRSPRSGEVAPRGEAQNPLAALLGGQVRAGSGLVDLYI